MNVICKLSVTLILSGFVDRKPNDVGDSLVEMAILSQLTGQHILHFSSILLFCLISHEFWEMLVVGIMFACAEICFHTKMISSRILHTNAMSLLLDSECYTAT